MTGRVVLIVGASSGIGRVTAYQLAAAGDRLILAARGKRALEATAAQCRALGACTVTTSALDVRDDAAVAQLVSGVIAEHRRLDAVIHTAAVVSYGAFTDTPTEIFDAVLHTNVLGPANVARAALPVFRRQRHGSLILLGSLLGDIAAPAMTPYVLSKHAVKILGRQLCLEHRDLPDVHISVVSPGGVDTPIYRQAANYQGRPGRPPAPVESPDKVARAIVRALDRPRARINVGVANPLIKAGFTVLPRVFDVLVGPLFQLLASKPGIQEPTAGNVLESRDEAGAVRGGEGQGLRDFLARAGKR
ncbi:MAG: SDR family NAD(P)-dependent oxidoreductase [Sporichthyaceae bacterium]